MTYTEIWQSLEAAALKQADGYVRRRITHQSVCDLFLAVAGPSNQHMFQIKLTETSNKAVANLPSARGLDAVVVRSENERTGFTIQLVLREQRFGTVFDALIHDIVEIISHAQSEAAAVAAFVGRLQHWQKFLEQVGPDGMSRQAQQGLYSELWFLRERLIPLVGFYPALLAWVGPGGAHQDFQLPSCAIEVKSTGTKEPQQLIIQSERQLDDTGLAALFLFHLSIDVREGAGESLVEMVDSLRQLIATDSVAMDLYEDRLLEAGFLQSHSSQYERTKYNIRQAFLYQVKNAFPRIVEADLKPGVGLVQYSIAAAECRHYVVSDDILKFQLAGSNNG